MSKKLSPASEARAFWAQRYLDSALNLEDQGPGRYKSSKLPLRRFSKVLEYVGAVLLAAWIGMIAVFVIFITLNRYFHVGAG